MPLDATTEGPWADFVAPRKETRTRLPLEDGARVAVVGGGPAGSFFGYFFLKMAHAVGLDASVDLYEPRDFGEGGPAGCNHCGGIISESLVQLLAAEGINLPASVVQRAIDSYVLHVDAGTVRIDTPLREQRIASVFRGLGPRGVEATRWGSFDAHLLNLAIGKGARWRRELVTEVHWSEGRPSIRATGPGHETYDLLVVAAGINSKIPGLLAECDRDYVAPGGVKTHICEFLLGEEQVRECLGRSMHVFLLDLPRLEFAALIPKGDYVTAVMLGEEIDEELVRSFLDSPEVRGCFPDDVRLLDSACHCFPRINVRAASSPFADRMVVVGDAGVSRLFKDGIGAAYRTAKVAASTAAFQGVSEECFRRHYLPVCRSLDRDNSIGKFLFGFSHQIQKWAFSRRAILRMTRQEQQLAGRQRHMSSVLWDMLTGSAPYRDVFVRTLHPYFIGSLGRNLVMASGPERSDRPVAGGAHGS